ncbi:tail assembly chaperone [Paenisporosarcina sp. OV554]|uniref:tail assembly chaperone n=1 Tax=Paenisporosarcina sp. OV554 TaxID=2135694 RepID=UPI000D33EF27|nr:tail assembly chaperone [Paenisporosarcina sp. OV554]PUB12627.1 tail assembly chaperone [Paenisporosarcina sp. OV554]
MAILNIKDTEHKAKCAFKFDKWADEKYNDEDKKGNKAGGFMNIYNNLLEFETKYLVAFWDCALAYLGKGKPSLSEIEDAIEERIEEDGDTEKLIKEAFNELTDSGFFKMKAKKYWKNLEILKDTGKDDEEKAENLKMYNMIQESRNAMKE